jgi:hypothetical protein
MERRADRRRPIRLAGAGVAAAAVLVVAGCGTSSTTSSSTTTSSSVVTTTTAGSTVGTAVWPSASSSQRYHDPVSVTRAFATDYLEFVGPVVGTFRQGDARSGEVDVRPKASGPVTTVLVRMLGTDGTWWVLSASTPDIRVSSPAAYAGITSPVTLAGTSTAFEATVRVSVRQDGDVTPLASGIVMGGANGMMAPFGTTLAFAKPTATRGAVVFDIVSAETGHVAQATVVPVGFP